MTQDKEIKDVLHRRAALEAAKKRAAVAHALFQAAGRRVDKTLREKEEAEERAGWDNTDAASQKAHAAWMVATAECQKAEADWDDAVAEVELAAAEAGEEAEWNRSSL